ncbi:MAG: hypothetical protein K5668_11420 [Lachnospiraceae bacterium]|nr:hypothetical protein [Lachnospiraceae bacterium]
MAKSSRWYKLDNAAKIVPSQARGADTRVFRLTAVLKEEVNKEILEQALSEVAPEFPIFNVVLKRGFFWYYLEDSDLIPEVKEEGEFPLEALYYPGKRALMYRVNYYRKRINLEVFHVISDGTGAFMFLRHLVAKYLEIRYSLPLTRFDDDISSMQENSADAFDTFYEKSAGLEQLKDMGSKRAWQLNEEKDPNLRCHLIEGVVSVGKFLEKAKECGTTVGIFSVAVYIEAAIKTMTVRQKKRPIVVSVPVNLRQFYQSFTARNFFSVINITFNATEYDGTINSIIPKVKSAFEEQLSKEKINENMNSYAALEHNFAVKMIPLIVKDIGISLFSALAGRGVTCTMSNLGKITMPDELKEYIDYFSAFMAAPSEQVCVSTFGDRMVFGEVSPYVTHGVMMNFFRLLTGMGIDVEISSNDYDEQEEKGAVLS